MKVSQVKYQAVHKDWARAKTKTIKRLSEAYELSPRTIKRIIESPTYPAYKIKLREKANKDWLIERGYEEIPILRKYIDKLKPKVGRSANRSYGNPNIRSEDN